MNIVSLIILGWFTLGIIGELVSSMILKVDADNENNVNVGFYKQHFPILYKTSHFIHVILYNGQLNFLVSIKYLVLMYIVRPLILCFYALLKIFIWVGVWVYRYFRLQKIYKRVKKLNPHFTKEEAVDRVGEIMMRFSKINNKKQ